MSRADTLIKMLLALPSRIFSHTSVLAVVRNSSIDRTAAIDKFTRFYDSSIGRYSYVGASCIVVNTTIGKFCSIAQNTIIGGANHPLDWVSTSPVFRKGENILGKNLSHLDHRAYEETTIGNDVWIGEGAMIMTGCNIGDGAVIAARAVVTRDVGPYSIVAGIPAKEIRKRFEAEDIAYLQELKWWDWSDEKLSSHGSSFNDLGMLKNRISCEDCPGRETNLRGQVK